MIQRGTCEACVYSTHAPHYIFHVTSVTESGCTGKNHPHLKKALIAKLNSFFSKINTTNK